MTWQQLLSATRQTLHETSGTAGTAWQSQVLTWHTGATGSLSHPKHQNEPQRIHTRGILLTELHGMLLRCSNKICSAAPQRGHCIVWPHCRCSYETLHISGIISAQATRAASVDICTSHLLGWPDRSLAHTAGHQGTCPLYRFRTVPQPMGWPPSAHTTLAASTPYFHSTNCAVASS